MSSKYRSMQRSINRSNGVSSVPVSSSSKTNEKKKYPWRAYFIIGFCLLGSILGVLSFFGIHL